MSAILLPTDFVLFSLLFLARRRNGLGASLLKAAITVFLIVWASTEVLSRLNAITRPSLVVLWVFVTVVVITALFYTLKHDRGLCRLKRKMALFGRAVKPSRKATVFVTLICVIVALAFVMAAMEYPYDADSLSYHMSRVANWVNNGNVDIYSTVNQRQNFYAPGAEYIMLHLQLLSGSDKCAVLPQYASMLLCLLLVAMIASVFRIDRDGRWFCAAVAATIPILIGQSHCNQNELVACAAILGFTWFLLQYSRRPAWAPALWCGCALGLSLLTKGTAFVYCAGIGIPLGLHAILATGTRRRLWGRMVVHLLAAVIIGLSILAPFVARCSRDGKTYLNNEFTEELRTTRFGWDILAANAIRNGAVHLGLPDKEWNECIEEWVRKTAGAQEKNDESSFRSQPFMMHPQQSCFYSANPLHLALALLTWLLAPLLLKVRCVGRTAAYFVATLACAVLFNLCLKWQYWGIRLQLLWFLLTVPLIGLIFFRSRIPPRARSVFQVTGVFILFLGALPALLYDVDLPLWQGRKPPLIFRDEMSIRLGAGVSENPADNPYHETFEYLRPFAPGEVGLFLPKGNSCFDYNWWVMWGTHARPGLPRLRHVGPDAWPESDARVPKWVIARSCTIPKTGLAGSAYKQVFRSGQCRVYQLTGDQAPLRRQTH